ncbi:hypothetical protein ANN_05160 [Periplaneta americana]|uniref:Uncharacterized protein n=1 Tax=Periplaneta americana TaxID=6978 RepID=A0ABQ8TAD1_PERAM|nr:hypothetical protein ANN_05160 [Periplaneta americana]
MECLCESGNEPPGFLKTIISVDEIGNSEMVFGEMRSKIRHRLPVIHITVEENLGKKSNQWQECELFGNTYCRDMGRGLRRLLTYLLTLTSTVNMDTEHLICVVECYRTQPMITNTLRTTCRRKTQFERGYGSTQTVQTAICRYDVPVIPYTFSSSD